MLECVEVGSVSWCVSSGNGVAGSGRSGSTFRPTGGTGCIAQVVGSHPPPVLYNRTG